MKTISLDLRCRIVEAYDEGESSQQEVAKRFKVSLGMVKKLLAQRSQTGDLRPRYRYCGRKARLEPEHGARLRNLVEQEPNLTLEQIKQRLDLDCTVAAIHWVLAKMGLTHKKRRSIRPTKVRPTSPKNTAAKNGANARPTRRGASAAKTRPSRRA